MQPQRTTRRPRVARICAVCATPFTAPASVVARGYGRFCGRDCWHQAHRATTLPATCLQCSAPFRVKPYVALDPQHGKFCSPACVWAHRRTVRRPLADRFWAKVQKSDGCWLWAGSLSPKGYGKLGTGGRDGIEMPASRIAWILTHGPIESWQYVCHNCPGGDNPACVRPDHLFLSDAAGNMADKVAKGRQQRGSAVPTSKLTESQVVEMRTRYDAGGITGAALAAEYGVSAPTVSEIVNRRTWRHLTT